MYCPNCGKEIEDDAQFCEFCGAALTKEAQNATIKGFKIDENVDFETAIKELKGEKENHLPGLIKILIPVLAGIILLLVIRGMMISRKTPRTDDFDENAIESDIEIASVEQIAKENAEDNTADVSKEIETIDDSAKEEQISSNMITETQDPAESNSSTLSANDDVEKPKLEDFYWVNDLQDRDKSPIQNAEQLTDANRIVGDWKVLLMDIPQDDDELTWETLLNMNISIDGANVSVVANWDLEYMLIKETMKPFSVGDTSVGEATTYVGSFNSDPVEKTIIVQDKENTAEHKKEFNGGGRIDTIRIDRFVEKNGKQYGVGSVFGVDGENIARIALVR